MALCSSSAVLLAFRNVSLRSFSTSLPASVNLKSIFGKTSQAEKEEPSEIQLTEKEIQRTNTLRQYDKSALQRIAAKGLGKVVLPYHPPSDVGETMRKIFNDNINISDRAVTDPLSFKFPDLMVKFKFLTACEHAFSHSVPNSQLYEIRAVGDVLNFYLKPVEGINGLTQYQRIPDLPPNLHINYEPSRFDPDNDPIYGGITAFPHTHTPITGLKYRKMYKSRRAETNWPRVLDCRPMGRDRGHKLWVHREY